jgi:hypothetical protein
VHGHGYRFIAAVTTCHPQVASPAVPPVPQPPIPEEPSPTLEAPEPMAQLPQTGHRLPEGERKEVTVLSARGIPRRPPSTLRPDAHGGPAGRGPPQPRHWGRSPGGLRGPHRP